jgi:hypothetical protein
MAVSPEAPLVALSLWSRQPDYMQHARDPINRPES